MQLELAGERKEERGQMAYFECLGEFSSGKYTVRDPIESYISRSTLYYYAP